MKCKDCGDEIYSDDCDGSCSGCKEEENKASDIFGVIGLVVISVFFILCYLKVI